MKNNLNCNGCRYTVEKNRIACDCCVDRSNYSPRQRIRYGEDLDADIYTAIQKAMTNLSVTGTFMPAIENVMLKRIGVDIEGWHKESEANNVGAK